MLILNHEGGRDYKLFVRHAKIFLANGNEFKMKELQYLFRSEISKFRGDFHATVAAGLPKI